MQPSTYGRIGGGPAVEGALDLFHAKVWVYEKVSGDPAFAQYFEGVDRTRRKAHQRAFMTAGLAGSADAAFDQVIAHLAATLSGLGLDEGTVGELAGELAPLRAGLAAAVADGF